MEIKVAYDITLLGDSWYYFKYSEGKSGISRVVEEVMYELIKNNVNLTVMGLCNEEPLISSLHCLLYTKNTTNSTNYNFTNSFKSRLKLTTFYKYFYNKFGKVYFSERFQRTPKLSLESIVLRGTLKLVHQIYKFDTYKFINCKNFDVFHSPYLKLPTEELTGDLPRVLTVYDLIPVIAPQFVFPADTAKFQLILNSINTKRDWVICISEYTKQKFCEYTGMSCERVFVAPLAAASHFHPVNDPERIAASRQRYLIPDGDYFLSVATFQPRKNIAHLISCFFHLLSENPTLDVNLVLVGSKGWMSDEVFTAASSSSKFHSKIIFTGYISDEELSPIYSGAKAFIYPSLYEGFGLPPLEAMQCGIPVITSNTTSIPEVVGGAGIMVDPKDSDALCQAMLNLLNNTALCQELRQKGLERAKSFSWVKCAADTVEVYKKAISI